MLSIFFKDFLITKYKLVILFLGLLQISSVKATHVYISEEIKQNPHSYHTQVSFSREEECLNDNNFDNRDGKYRRIGDHRNRRMVLDRVKPILGYCYDNKIKNIRFSFKLSTSEHVNRFKEFLNIIEKFEAEKQNNIYKGYHKPFNVSIAVNEQLLSCGPNLILLDEVTKIKRTFEKAQQNNLEKVQNNINEYRYTDSDFARRDLNGQ